MFTPSLLSSIYAARSRQPVRILLIICALIATAVAASAQFSASSPTTDWVVVAYRPGAQTDIYSDQQTGQGEADIVGYRGVSGPNLPSFYMKLVPGNSPTNGTLYFRIRVGGDQSPAGFKASGFVGVDANRDGKLDLFFGVDNSGTSDAIYIWKAGTGANISPSTTTVDSRHPVKSYAEVNGTNYHWAAVNSASNTAGVQLDPLADDATKQDLNSATGTDYFLTYSLPFADLVAALGAQGIAFNSSSVANYVMGTSTQANAFNQDLNGVSGSTSSTTTWASLGAMTQPITASGAVMNTPPVNTVPGAQTANGSLALRNVSVADAEGNLASVQITATNGTASVSLAGGATIIAGTNSSSTFTLGGTQAQINSALATLGYTPTTGFTGAASVTVFSKDSSDASDTDSIAITVTSGANNAPVAVNDSASTHSGKAVTTYVIGNDTDADNNILTITAATLTTGQGTVSYSDGNITYTPSTSFVGTATIPYTISDGRSGTSSATLTVTVAANKVPVAVNDAINANPGSTILIDALANDSDADGDALTITGASRTSGLGTVSVVSNMVQFAAPNSAGTTTISYTISDGSGGTATATITVTIGTNTAPVAQNDTATATSGTPVQINVLANDSDADGDALTITDATLTSGQGTALAINGSFTYTPASNYNGSDSFTYKANDGTADSNIATVSITVVSVNDAPVAVNDSASTAEDTAKTIDVLTNDSDADGDSLNVTAASVTSGGGSVVINADKTITFTPAANFNGTATLSYTISDGTATASATVTVTVTPVNDAPVANNDSITLDEDSGATNVLVRANDTDVDGDTLTVTAVTQGANGAVAIVGGGTHVTYTPAANFNGADSFTYTISDGNGGTATATVNVTVAAVNDAPVAVNDSYTVNEDQTLTVNASGILGNDTDVDGNALTAALVASPSKGTLALNANGSFTYTPNSNFNGADSFTYRANDGAANSNTATVSITITAVNDAPVAVDDSATTAEDTAKTINVLSNDSDVDGDTLNVTAASVTSGGGSVVINADKTITFTPAANYNGTATLSYTISDGTATASAVVTVTITAVNDAPVANNDSATVNEDSGANTILVRANDTDVDGDVLTVMSITQGAKGAVAIAGGGTHMTYTPAANLNGSDSFTYTVSDGNGGTATATVNVTITAINDAPVAADDSYTVNEDQTLTVSASGVLSNDTDVESNTLSAVLITGPSHGTLVLNVDGSFTYTPAGNYNGSDSFTYKANDGAADSNVATVSITITAVNDAPVAVDDSTSTAEDTAKTISVLSNDSDADGDILSVTEASVTSGGGSVVINADKTITFTPVANFNGTAKLSYTITDGAATASAVVTVTVTAVNDAPVAEADKTITLNEDDAPVALAVGAPTDIDGDTLTITVTSIPNSAKGAVRLSDNSVVANGATLTLAQLTSLVFAPAPDATGAAGTFAYVVKDGNGGTATQTVTFIITPVNDVPVADADKTLTVLEDSLPTGLDISAPIDVENNTLTITVTGIPAVAKGEVRLSNGTAVANGATLTVAELTSLVFVPALNANGAAGAFSYSVNDGNGGVDSQTVTINITPVNDAPVAEADRTVTVAEDSGSTALNISNPTDVDGDSLTITVTAIPTAAKGEVRLANGTAVANGVTLPFAQLGGLLFAPVANANGAAGALSYSVNDGNGGTASQTITFSITPANDAPVADADKTITLAEDSAPVSLAVSVPTDVDGDTLTITVTALPNAPKGEVRLGGGTPVAINSTLSATQLTGLVFAPVQDANGAGGSFIYTVADGNGGTATQTVTFIITPVNDAPTAQADKTVTVLEDSGANALSIAAPTDVDADALTITVTQLPTASKGEVRLANGTPVANGATLSAAELAGLTFTPATDENGAAGSFIYTAADGNSGSTSQTVTVKITPVNDAPVADADKTITVAEDSGATALSIGSPTDVDGDALTITVTAVPNAAKGEVRLNGGAAVASGATLSIAQLTGLVFVPALNANGSTGTFRYGVDDGNGGAASQTLTFQITAVNDAPVANNDTATTTEDTATTITVLGNDTDADGDTLTVTGASVTAAEGSVSVNTNGTLAFSPASNFNGTATIKYTISDGNGGTASADVIVTVTPANDAPVADNDTATTAEDTATTIKVLGNDTDADGDTLNVTTASVAPAQGAVTVNNDGTLTFVPALNFNGSATLNYTITDGNGGTASAIVTVTVTAVNDAPIATNDSGATPQDRPVIVEVVANDWDPESATLHVVSAMLYAGRGTVTVNADETLEFVPAAGFTGNATILYTITDGDGGTSSASVKLTVDGLPVATDDAATTQKNTAKVVDVLANDGDPEGQPLRITEVNVDASQGTASIEADGTVRFVPAQNLTGMVMLYYTVRDVAGNIASAKVVVTVSGAAQSDPPLAVSDRASTSQTTPVSISVLANDVDPAGSALTVAAATIDPAVGTVTVNPDNTVTFTAAPGFEGTAVIIYTVRNSAGATANAPAFVRVSGSNTPPIARDDTATAAIGVPKTIHVLTNDSDPDGDALTVINASSDPTQGGVTVNADGTLTFVSAPAFNGTASITYQLSDGRGGVSSGLVKVAVSAAPVNNTPVAMNDAVGTPVGVPVSANVLLNDSDPDGDVLTVTSVNVPASQGTATLNPDGSTAYVPAAGFNDTAQITYTVSDGNGGTSTAILTINVNDNPVAVTDVALTLPGTPVTLNLLTNDSDPNGNPLVLVAVTPDLAEGSVVINADGTVTFTPAAGFSGTASVFYTISDGKGGTAEGTALIMVNSPPAPTADMATTTINQPINVTVLGNDSDPDGDPLIVTGATVDPTQGTVIVNPDGTVTFEPAPTFTGPAVITYTVTDGKGAVRSATATISRANAVPTAAGRTVYTYCTSKILVNPLRTAADLDGDNLTVVAISRPAKGTATLQPDGLILYTPRVNFLGKIEDSFVVTLSDGKGGFTQTTVTVRAFGAIAGTFGGLLGADTIDAAIPTAYRGRISITLNSRAAFTARLELDGKVIGIRGALTGALTYQRTIQLNGRPVTLVMTYDEMADRWSVTVSGENLALQDVNDVLRLKRTQKLARYKAMIAPRAAAAAADAQAPAGDAAITLYRTGATTVIGHLPNGKVFTASARLDANGSLSVYRWLAATRKSAAQALGGVWEVSAAQGTANVNGELQWRTPAITPVAPDDIQLLDVFTPVP